MSHILILGGGGFLGANLSRTLLRSGFRVSILEKPGANLNHLGDILPSLTIFEAFLHETERIRNILRTNAIDTVIHLVSSLLPSSPGTDFTREQREVVDPTFHLLTEFAELGIKIVFFSSGGTVYGKGLNSPFRESDPLAPINFYGFSKALIENGIAFRNRVAGLKYLVLRPSNPYGRFQPLHGKQGFISVVLGKAFAGETVEIWGDGSVVRDYLFVDDLSRAVTELLLKDVHNVTLNIGSGVGHSLVQVLETVEELIGRRLPRVFYPARTVDSPAVVLDITNLKRHIPFIPIDLHQGILDYYQWLKVSDGI